MDLTTLIKTTYVISTACSLTLAGAALYTAKKQHELTATIKDTNWQHVMWNANEQKFVVIPVK